MNDKFVHYWRFVLFILLIVFLSSCTRSASNSTLSPKNDSVETPTSIVPDAGSGAIIGRFANAQAIWPDKPVFVYAAQFYGDEGGEGAFILEPTVFPRTRLDADGYFQINNVPPRKYVLIVGPSAEGGLLVEVENTTQVYEVVEDEVLDIGTISINP